MNTGAPTSAEPIELSDGVVAAMVASQAGELLSNLRDELFTSGTGRYMWIDEKGDAAAHEFIAAELERLRPEDHVLSEEGADRRDRLGARRVWIVDPLDGSSDYGQGSGDWAVHIALLEDGEATHGAVAVPSMGAVFSTHVAPTVPASDRDQPLIVVGRSRVYSDGERVANALGAQLATCGSAGVKAMLVVLGEVDAYVHGGALHEWDACAPAVVAQAAGLTVSDAFGRPLEFNQPRTVMPGLVVSRPEFHQPVIDALGRR